MPQLEQREVPTSSLPEVELVLEFSPLPLTCHGLMKWVNHGASLTRHLPHCLSHCGPAYAKLVDKPNTIWLGSQSCPSRHTHTRDCTPAHIRAEQALWSSSGRLWLCSGRLAVAGPLTMNLNKFQVFCTFISLNSSSHRTSLKLAPLVCQSLSFKEKM